MTRLREFTDALGDLADDARTELSWHEWEKFVNAGCAMLGRASERAPLVTALEALEDGDVERATACLRSAVSGFDAPEKVHACPVCDLKFAWPGQLDVHLRWVHGADGAAA